ncbi:unnamed protein product [Dovyalis caffra]|uniref:Uncharacterized protein n=1 Tax=Dovyalis caffra TaxID=77055 RepID=A0AAV1QWM4_9ROSI|nr:unnamed protein product [Dovyalis caffra]
MGSTSLEFEQNALNRFNMMSNGPDGFYWRRHQSPPPPPPPPPPPFGAWSLRHEKSTFLKKSVIPCWKGKLKAQKEIMTPKISMARVSPLSWLQDSVMKNQQEEARNSAWFQKFKLLSQT